MKKNFRFMAMAAVAVAAAVFTGCSSDDDFLTPYEESAIQTRAMSSTNAIINFDNASENVMASDQYGANWKSHATLTLLATQDLPTFGYNMIDPLKSWCCGSILFYPFKISRFS